MASSTASPGQRPAPIPIVSTATRESAMAASSGPRAAPASMVKRDAAQDAQHGMGRVLIIYTGGTMGMKRQENGTLAPQRGVLGEDFLFTYYGVFETDCSGTPEASWKWEMDKCTKGPTDALQENIEETLGCECHRIIP